MKFRVERDALADAVAWTARSLPARPSVPVLAGCCSRSTDNTLTVSGFDYEVSTQVEVEVHADGRRPGAGLAAGCWPRSPGRCRRTRSTWPPTAPQVDDQPAAAPGSPCRRMPVEDYPTLPTMPTTAGVVDSAAFADAVAQVAVAAGRDDTLPMLTGVRLEIEGDELHPGRHRPLPARRPRAALAAGAARAVGRRCWSRPGRWPTPPRRSTSGAGDHRSRCPAAAPARA